MPSVSALGGDVGHGLNTPQIRSPLHGNKEISSGFKGIQGLCLPPGAASDDRVTSPHFYKVLHPMETPSPVPADEASILAALMDPGRVAAVRDTGLLDTPPEESFDRLTRLAARLTGAPVTFVSLLDFSRDFYKSAFGLGEPLNTTRQLEGRSFCHYAMVSDGPLVLPDVTQLAGFCDVPTVRSLGVRAYAGIPLVTAQGHVLGSFCAVDFEPRQWTETDIEVLVELAHSAMREIQLRKAVRDSDALNLRLQEQLRRVDELNKALAELATKDSLTGLFNRRAFDHSLALELAIVERRNSPLSLLMLDVDHFKRINDSLGHAAGDEVLKQIGCILSAGARVIDVVARVGGEEFAILLPNTNMPDAVDVAERMRVAVSQAPWSQASSATVSVGVATLMGGENACGLYARADAALYGAKQGGRNRVATA